MGIYATDFRELVVRPTLQQLNDWSPAAENLLLGTAAQESQLGFRLQNHDEYSLGLYRISAETHTTTWDTFLVQDPDLASRVRGLASQQQFLRAPHKELITNMSYATAVAWMIYRHRQVKLPDSNDIYELAHCWLDCYRQRDEHGSLTNPDLEIEKFMQTYRKWVLREHKRLAA